jgi:perosamine synthetase
MERIPVAGPSITRSEIDMVTDAVTRCWYSHANDYHVEFERAVAQTLGVKYAVALPSCTSGLHLALAALGIGPGDEVIVPDLTWIATSAPITYLDATPVFADVDPDSWCLSPESLKENISEHTRAIIVVDLYGNMPRMSEILAIAKAHNIPVIEDAAEAIGSKYNGQYAGTFGDIGVYSFHGSKTLTTGEGGMLMTNDDEIYQRVQILRDHGRHPGDFTFFNQEVAYKYKMTSMQAALGLAQWNRLEELVAIKRKIFQWYHDRLKNVAGLTLNPEPAHVRNSYWMVTAVFDESLDLRKDQLITLLAQQKIDTRPFFHPLSSLPAYDEYPTAENAMNANTVAYDLSPRGINLPSGYHMTEVLVDRVCQSLIQILDSYGEERAAA